MRIHSLILGGAALLAALAAPVGAAEPTNAPAMPAVQPTNGPAYILAYLEVGAPSAKSAAALVRKFVAATRKEKGVVSFEGFSERGRPTRLAVLGEWRDAAALAAHRKAAYTESFRNKIQPMLVAMPDVRQETGYVIGAAGRPGGRRALHVIAHVDVVPPSKDPAATMLKALAETSRKQPGNLRFDVLEQISRPNHFTLVEDWRSRKAYEAYRMAPATMDFREKLLPMQGALYDERLYSGLR